MSSVRHAFCLVLRSAAGWSVPHLIRMAPKGTGILPAIQSALVVSAVQAETGGLIFVCSAVCRARVCTAALLRVCLGLLCMQSKSSVQGNQSARPISQFADPQKCGKATFYLIGVQQLHETRPRYVALTTLGSRSEQSYILHHSARSLWRLLRPCCSLLPVLSWQGDWALGPSSPTPLATCLLGARAPMTQCT